MIKLANSLGKTP